MIQIQIQGLDRVNSFLVKLPKNVVTEIELAGDEFSKFVQKSAKLRAPRFSGQLAESITVTHPKKNRIEVNVNSPYGIFQEKGFTPRFLPSNLVVNGGYRIGDWMKHKGISGFGIKPSGRPHPFIKPALEVGLSNLPNLIQRHLQKAIKNSGGKR